MEENTKSVTFSSCKNVFLKNNVMTSMNVTRFPKELGRVKRKKEVGYLYKCLGCYQSDLEKSEPTFELGIKH